MSLIRRNDGFKIKIAGFQNTQFKLASNAPPNANTSAFLDRCIELLVDHKLTTETTSMIKYSAIDMRSVVDECLQLFGEHVGLPDWYRMYADNRVARTAQGPMKL
jgi:acyl-CoA dehydrogenase